MSSPNRLVITYKVMEQLGVMPVLLNALYRFGLLTGHYRRVTGKPPTWRTGPLKAVLPIPKRNELEQLLGGEGQKNLLAEANEICGGNVRLFGGLPVPLQLGIPGGLDHWTAYETGKKSLPLGQLEIPDIKFVWEPARFGWAYALGRAYLLSNDDRYAQSFWQYFEMFAEANPPYIGPHWMSGQEVGLRLMAFVWATQVFSTAPASTPDRKNRLAASVAVHAHRIPPTLVYARSQQNNHLLSEAAGLLTAGLALPEHPQASRWSTMGWKWLNIGIRSQIDGYGEYTQHSTNYQRLMLQIVLWVDAMIRFTGQASQISAEMNSTRWPRNTSEAIARATHWLLALLDPVSGRTPNLGANDGAYIFPLTTCPFEDYRPVLHASARAFLNYDLPRGPWDEMSAWFGIPSESKEVHSTTALHWRSDLRQGLLGLSADGAVRFASLPC